MLKKSAQARLPKEHKLSVKRLTSQQQILNTNTRVRCTVCPRNKDTKTKYRCDMCQIPMCQYHMKNICATCLIKLEDGSDKLKINLNCFHCCNWQIKKYLECIVCVQH